MGYDMLAVGGVLVAMLSVGCKGAGPMPPSNPLRGESWYLDLNPSASCACGDDRGGQLSSALCERFRSSSHAESSFEYRPREVSGTYSETPTRGVLQYSRSGKLTVSFAAGETPPPTLRRMMPHAVSFLAHPLCSDRTVRLLRGELFQYTEGAVIEARGADSPQLLVYLGGDVSVPKGVSLLDEDEVVGRLEFFGWGFHDRDE